MSGHSKWSTIKRKKGVADAKRGKIFTKLIREIQTAARMGGGDADSNPRLRLSVEKARSANMPKDNIVRAIQKGIGGGEGASFEEITYEGYGPGGTAIMVEVLTDNRNRAIGEVRHVFSKFGGNLGSAGCVSYLFEKTGLIIFDSEKVDSDALLEAALEAGADDVREGAQSLDVTSAPGTLEEVRDRLTGLGFEPMEAQVTMEPSSTVVLEGPVAESVLRFTDALDDLDDVQAVYANFAISEHEMAKLS